MHYEVSENRLQKHFQKEYSSTLKLLSWIYIQMVPYFHK